MKQHQLVPQSLHVSAQKASSVGSASTRFSHKHEFLFLSVLNKINPNLESGSELIYY